MKRLIASFGDPLRLFLVASSLPLAASVVVVPVKAQNSEQLRVEEAILALPEDLQVPLSPDPASEGILVPVSIVESREALANRLDASDFDWGAVQARGVAQMLQGILRDENIETIQLVLPPREMRTILSEPHERVNLGGARGLEGFFIPQLRDVQESHIGIAGRMVGPESGNVGFVVTKEGLVGMVSRPSGTVEIIPVGHGLHIVAKTRPAPLERDVDDVEVLDDDEEESHDDVLDVGPDDGKAETVDGDAIGTDCAQEMPPFEIDVVIGITSEADEQAASISRNVNRRAEIHEVTSNWTFEKSGIPGRVRIVDFVFVEFRENIDDPLFSREMAALRSRDESLKPLFEAKETAEADVIVLVVHKNSEVQCGRAPGILVDHREAFVAVNWKCMDERWSFIHEVGHLAGAWHNPEAISSTGKRKPPFAHGYCSAEGKFATIMAKSERCGEGWKKDWYWSNPEVRNEGGQPVGTQALHNNACLWKVRGPVVAAFSEAAKE